MYIWVIKIAKSPWWSPCVAKRTLCCVFEGWLQPTREDGIALPAGHRFLALVLLQRCFNVDTSKQKEQRFLKKKLRGHVLSIRVLG